MNPFFKEEEDLVKVKLNKIQEYEQRLKFELSDKRHCDKYDR